MTSIEVSLSDHNKLAVNVWKDCRINLSGLINVCIPWFLWMSRKHVQRLNSYLSIYQQHLSLSLSLSLSQCMNMCIHIYIFVMDARTDRRTDRQTNRQIDR